MARNTGKNSDFFNDSRREPLILRLQGWPSPLPPHIRRNMRIVARELGPKRSGGFYNSTYSTGSREPKRY